METGCLNPGSCSSPKITEWPDELILLVRGGQAWEWDSTEFLVRKKHKTCFCSVPTYCLSVSTIGDFCIISYWKSLVVAQYVHNSTYVFCFTLYIHVRGSGKHGKAVSSSTLFTYTVYCIRKKNPFWILTYDLNKNMKNTLIGTYCQFNSHSHVHL